MKTIYVTSGVGIAPKPFDLLAFDRALQAANIADLNHIQVSSIIPPNTEIITTPPPLKNFPYGRVTHTVYAKAIGQEKAMISACLVLLQSHTKDKRGVIFEVSGEMKEEEARYKAYEMAKAAMIDRSLLGFSFTPLISSVSLKVPTETVGCVVVAAVMDF